MGLLSDVLSSTSNMNYDNGLGSQWACPGLWASGARVLAVRQGWTGESRRVMIAAGSPLVGRSPFTGL